jgi:para-nitrobenzyl esterase
MIRKSISSWLALTAFCTIMLGAAGTAAAKTKAPSVKIKNGTVVGMTVGAVDEFLGIPYAAPPVGALRWLPPTAPAKFKKPFEATAFGSECEQPADGVPTGSENCLFLNVYAPAASKTKKNDDDSTADAKKKKSSGLPVMMWIHGGGDVTGSSNIYDPAPMVAQGVIVVTINYRLGLFGFFAHPAIDAEGHLNGNYGLMDQQFALKWIQANIKAFGGNPKQVTIFGQSAGGQNVYSQLASPLAAGLFEGAISESGSSADFQDYFPFYVTLAVAETTGTPAVPSGVSIAETLGCGSSATSACLRGVTAAAIVPALPGDAYPIVDGTLLTQTEQQAFADGEFNKVPVITGTSHNDDSIFVAFSYDLSGNPILSLAEYETAVLALWGSPLNAYVDAIYPYASYPTGGQALSASGTDGIYACTMLVADNLLSNYTTTYTYEFNDENAPPPSDEITGLTYPLGAYHGAELQFIFSEANFTGFGVGVLSPDEMQLSTTMISYWTEFAKTGDPNSTGQPNWPTYSSTNNEFLSLIPPTPTTETDFDTDHICTAFWNTF